MTDIRLEVDASEVHRALAAAPGEARRAHRNALNDTARDVQGAERDHILRAFDVRQKQYILNSVKITKEDRATTDHLKSAVGIDPQRDILARFEKGGRRISIAGKKYLAVPSREIRSGGGHVKPAFALKRFQPFVQVSHLHAVTLKGTERVADRRPRLIGQHGAFFMTLDGGAKAIMQRTARRGLRLLYILRPSVQLPAILEFENIAKKIIPVMWPLRASQAITHALRRAGLTVRE